MTLKKIFYVLIALALFFVGIHRLFLRQPDSLETISSSVIYPVLLFQNFLVQPVQKTYYNWITNKRLLKELSDSQATIDMLQSQLISLQATQNLIDTTQDMRDFAARYYPLGNLAHIIMKEFDGHHTYIIDKGSHKGIELDMVAVYNNCLIGRVTTVYPYWSKVTLLSDPTCKIAAYTSQSLVHGILEGTSNINTTQLSYISHLQHVEIGELVFSSGEGLIFPKGFALGRIDQVTPDGFNLKIDVETLVDLKQLSYCYIIKKGAYELPRN